jgi:tetratricopeptide (TPR) repeat protein
LLVLDDLQWAGTDALELLLTLARTAAEIPLRVVGAYRDTDLRPEDPLAVALADLATSGLAARRLLGPLTSDDAAQLVDDLLGDAAAARERIALRERVLRRSGGVPFFLVSCVQAALREEEDMRDGAVPWDLAQSVRQRLVSLPEAAREVLGVAAVIGRVLEGALLSTVTALPEEVVLLGVEAACRARLLEEQGSTTFQFAHDVIREVVEADVSAARRALLHRRVAEALEQRPGECPVERLAYHYSRSDAGEKALGYLEQAGDRAQAQYAHAAAEIAYRDVLARLDGLGRDTHAARVRVKMGATLEIAALYDPALAVLEAAATTYQAGGDLEGLRRTWAQFGRVHAARGTPAEGLARIRPLLEALEGSEPSPGSAAVYAALAWLFLASGRHREGIAAAEQAADLARDVADDPILADVLVRRATALTAMGRLEEGRRAAEAAIPLVEAVGDLSALGRTCNNLAIIYRARGQFDRSRGYRERALAVTEQIGEVVGRRWALAGLGELLFLRGEWDAARVQLERAAELTHSRGWSLMAEEPLLGLAALHLAMGEWEGATRYIEESLLRSRALRNSRRWLLERTLLEAERDLLDGHPATASARLMRVLDSDRDVVQVLSLLAWARLDAGDVAQASELVAQACTRAQAECNLLALVDALRIQAMVATRQRRWMEAQAAVEEGIALARPMPYPYAEARLLHVNGTLHREAGEAARAREHLEAALAIFHRLGARKDAERTEHLLAALS